MVNSEHYISFDIFDTLIKRSVAQPKDIFRLMERTAVSYDGAKLPLGFADKRIAAEKYVNKKYGKPATLEQIYKRLQYEFGDAALKWMEIELQMELSGCQPNAIVVSQFHQCCERGEKIILISDMYLPSSFISKMLDKCGVRGYQKIFVSCEYGACKRDGSLFRAVLKELRIRPCQLTHMGDARKADFLIPLSMGIRVKLPVVKDQKKLSKIPSFIAQDSALSYRTIQTVITRCVWEMNEYRKHGCTILGPLLAGYTFWLAEQLKKDGIHDVYFLSRDGYLLKRAFDLLKVEGIHSHYLYASRRSYLLPTLWMHPRFEEVILRISQVNIINLELFLEKIGLEPKQYEEQARKYGIPLDRFYSHGSFWKSIEVKNFYDSILDDVIQKSKTEYEAILSYFRECEFPDRIAVADVGYRGTIQNLLCELLESGGIKVEVTGYYISLDSDSNFIKQQAIRAREYLQKSYKDYYRYIHSASALFEAQFLKNEGSVESFYLRGTKPKIKFLNFEYDIEAGRIVNEVKNRTDYQDGALCFVQYIFGIMRTFLIEPDAAFYHWYKLAYHPSLHEADMWGDFRMENSGKLYYLARPHGWRKYFIEPNLLKEDFLYNCPWKIGFMRRMFRVPLPYDKIYFSLKKIYSKE